MLGPDCRNVRSCHHDNDHDDHDHDAEPEHNDDTFPSELLRRLQVGLVCVNHQMG